MHFLTVKTTEVLWYVVLFTCIKLSIFSWTPTVGSFLGEIIFTRSLRKSLLAICMWNRLPQFFTHVSMTWEITTRKLSFQYEKKLVSNVILISLVVGTMIHYLNQFCIYLSVMYPYKTAQTNRLEIVAYHKTVRYGPPIFTDTIRYFLPYCPYSFLWTKKSNYQVHYK